MSLTQARSKQSVVGIAELIVTGEPDAVLVTYALGSCIGLTAWDPIVKVGGLLHFMLPESGLDTTRGRSNPAMYADTGIPQLFEACVANGANKRRLVVRAAGGAQVLNDNGVFNIGNRNHLSMRKALWKAGILLHAEMTGGNISRSVSLELSTGKVLIREGGTPWRELDNKPGPGRTR
jgi:chemotaxis protein CheD